MLSMQETVTLNTHEQKRVVVLKRIQAGQQSVAEAAVLLEMSQRQVQPVFRPIERRGSLLLSTRIGVVLAI